VARRPAPTPVAVPTLDTELVLSRLPGATVLSRAGPRLGLHTVRDLLFHLPRDHRDLRTLLSAAAIARLPDKASATAVLEVVRLAQRQTGGKRRLLLTSAVLADTTGQVSATWFGRRFIERQLREGDRALFSGKVRRRGWEVTLSDPEFEREDGREALHAGRIVPVYRLTHGLSARTVRLATRAALDRFAASYTEYLPPEIRGELMPIERALEQVHFPDDPEALAAALRRLAFDELLALQVGMVARKRSRAGEEVPPIRVEAEAWAACIAGVEAGIAAGIAPGGDESPAERIRLTDDQAGALDSIRLDLASGQPMMRLIQGDVGSGKTAVAAVAMALVAGQGGQSALLAPTDLLARQHAATLGRLLEPVGHDVMLMSGSATAAERREARSLAGAPMPRGTAGRSRGLIFVGTHALISEAVAFADLRLAVVDEQHRFGVADREALAAKGTRPHVLLMTATPIPRTLGQILHADLDVSDIRSAPSGRRPIRTGIRTPDELIQRHDGRQGPLAYLAAQVAEGNRGFVIVPLVHPAEPDPDLPPPPGPPLTDVATAVALVEGGWEAACEAAGVRGTPLHLAVVHGQMKAAERDAQMARFRSGEVDVLVGTTVLEVGVDIPDATAMIVLDADRFGIAQLHQLRGRVGRGTVASGCVLVSAVYPDPAVRDTDLEPAALLVRRRLDALRDSTDGFALAELDFELRREGELLGLQQSGLPPLRVASLADRTHRALSIEARRHAEAFLDGDGRLGARYADLERELHAGWLRRVGAGDVLDEEELDG
jgi:ATP-dependent DNA helicase RecG